MQWSQRCAIKEEQAAHLCGVGQQADGGRVHAGRGAQRMLDGGAAGGAGHAADAQAQAAGVAAAQQLGLEAHALHSADQAVLGEGSILFAEQPLA